MTENLEAYQNLANAIIRLAAKDYRRYRRKVERDWDTMSEYDKKLLTGKIKQLENFFASGYGMFLSGGLGDVILEKLQKEFEGGENNGEHHRNHGRKRRRKNHIHA